MKFLAYEDQQTPLNIEFSIKNARILDAEMENASSNRLFDLLEVLCRNKTLDYFGDFGGCRGHGYSRIIIWPLSLGLDYHMRILSHAEGFDLKCKNYSKIGSLPTPFGALAMTISDITHGEDVIGEYYSQFMKA